MTTKTAWAIIFILFALAPVAWVYSLKDDAPLELGVKMEETELQLKVQGQFPLWLDGVLVRNSAIPIYKDGKQITHFFDGLAMLHGFAFRNGEVFYTNRYLRSQEYNDVVNLGVVHTGFGTESDSLLWGKDHEPTEKAVANASVNVFKYGSGYVALTEIPLPVNFDLKTLETLGSFNFNDTMPKGQCWESAHPHYDYSTKEIFNYLIEFGQQSYYVLYKMQEGSSTRELIAKVPVEMPSYMHSFGMTEHYLILAEFPLVYNAKDMLTTNKSFVDLLKWEPERGTRFIIVEKSSGKVVSEAVAEPIYAFHHANAYEAGNGRELIIDIAARDLATLSFIFPQASFAKEQKQPLKHGLVRYHLALDQNQITSEILLDGILEFPRIDDRLDGKKYRYLYMASFDKAKSGLYKLDLADKINQSWMPMGYQTSEPIFVSSPEGENEDDGVVLSIISDLQNHRFFLVALDGHTFNEIARAELPHHIPGTFHGQYFTESVFLPSK